MELTADSTNLLDKILSGEFNWVGIIIILYILTLVFEVKSPGVVSRINPLMWVIALVKLITGRHKTKGNISEVEKNAYYKHMQFKKSQIQNIKTGDLAKDDILKTLITEIVNAFDNNFKSVFNNEVLKDLNSVNETVDFMSTLVLNSITEYKKGWINAGVPKEVIAKFTIWHEVIEKILISHLKDLGSIGEHDDIKSAVLNCLEFIISMISLTIEESGDIMSKMNGDLNGIEFNGNVIGKLDSNGLPKNKAKRKES